uniref:F-box domain-containing protein n=1 Tax=Steinernema glaseri TaxID=37863 RepID=A0A1I8AQS5_9BILA
MNSVPVAFLDTLCATLQKTDLKELQKIDNRWSRTVETHCSRRRELIVYLYSNDDETEVWMRINEVPNYWNTHVPYSTLTKHDRIRRISMRWIRRELLPETIPMKRFRTKVLPVLSSMTDAFILEAYAESSKKLWESLFSVLHAPALKIKTNYLGGKCVEFIERQIALGRLEELDLCGQEWPKSMKASLLAFWKSPNFECLDISETNLTVDLEILIIMVERFLKGELCMETSLCGKPSDGKMKELREAVRSGGTLPLLEGIPQPSKSPSLWSSCDIKWTGPSERILRASFSTTNLYIRPTYPAYTSFASQ